MKTVAFLTIALFLFAALPVKAENYVRPDRTDTTMASGDIRLPHTPCASVRCPEPTSIYAPQTSQIIVKCAPCPYRHAPSAQSRRSRPKQARRPLWLQRKIAAVDRKVTHVQQAVQAEHTRMNILVQRHSELAASQNALSTRQSSLEQRQSTLEAKVAELAKTAPEKGSEKEPEKGTEKGPEKEPKTEKAPEKGAEKDSGADKEKTPPGDGIEVKPSADYNSAPQEPRLQYAVYNPSNRPQVLLVDDETEKKPAGPFNLTLHARELDGETPMMGVTFTLTQGNTVLATGATGPKGDLAFNKVPPVVKDGEAYVVKVTATPSGKFPMENSYEVDPENPDLVFKVGDQKDILKTAQSARDQARGARGGTYNTLKAAEQTRDGVNAIRGNLPPNWAWKLVIITCFILFLVVIIACVFAIVTLMQSRREAPQGQQRNP